MNTGDLKKKREILFSKFPPGQVPETNPPVAPCARQA